MAIEPIMLHGLFLPFWAWQHFSCITAYIGRVRKLFDFIENTLICVNELDEWRYYGFGMTWGWVINDRILIFGWTIPLKIKRRAFYRILKMTLSHLQSLKVWLSDIDISLWKNETKPSDTYKTHFTGKHQTVQTESLRVHLCRCSPVTPLAVFVNSF